MEHREMTLESRHVLFPQKQHPWHHHVERLQAPQDRRFYTQPLKQHQQN